MHLIWKIVDCQFGMPKPARDSNIFQPGNRFPEKLEHAGTSQNFEENNEINEHKQKCLE